MRVAKVKRRYLLQKNCKIERRPLKSCYEQMDEKLNLKVSGKLHIAPPTPAGALVVLTGFQTGRKSVTQPLLLLLSSAGGWPHKWSRVVLQSKNGAKLKII